MTTGRMEAFSDGVVAILITIMVLDLPLPRGPDWAALQPVVPELLAYILSFVFLGIYWNNHHHMLHLTGRVTGGILWANLLLLFCLSLVPFCTRWLADRPSAAVPAACYGIVLIGAACAYTLLQTAIVRDQGEGSRLRQAVGRDRKGKVSLALLRHRHCARLCGSLVGRRPLRTRGGDVAGTRSAHRDIHQPRGGTVNPPAFRTSIAMRCRPVVPPQRREAGCLR